MKSLVHYFASKLALYSNGLHPVILTVREHKFKNGNFSKLHVYVADPTLSRMIEHLTGTRTLRPRHFLALSQMGYRFHLPRPTATVVPAWLPKWIGVEIA